MSEQQTTTAIVKADQFAIVQQGVDQISEIISENIGDSMSPFDLPQIPFPTGGSTFFETDWSEDPIKEVKGIILQWKPQRVYWEDKDQLGTPPDCFSPDGKIGHGMPGGECAVCPLAQFSENNTRPSCKGKRALFILMPDMILPVVLMVPPTSLKPLKKYTLALATKATVYWKVLTSITLEKTKNKEGTDYALAKFKAAGPIPADLVEMIATYRKNIAPMLEQYVPKAEPEQEEE